ncbi:MAG: hydrogenase maturation nickel metallochaperone HypA [Gammaproteobacteria bacterium]|nr:hydrogenase maturation nickel metallochaperone HypA [Gammaproteobacteria bacterium]
MHELAVCQSLLREVARAAAANGAGEVTRVVVAVGSLSGVEGPLLARAFEVARCGTIASGAALEIEAVPVRVRCKICAAETETPVNALLCGRCGAWQVDVLSGEELLLTRVELVVHPT